MKNHRKIGARDGFLLGLGLVILFYGMLHIFTKELLLDDIYLEDFYKTNALLDALKLRYETWTGRVLIEFIGALIMRCPFILWQILDTLMYGIIYACLWKMMGVEGKNSIFLAMAVCCYIFLQMASAGWQITSVIYVGTMGTALVCGVIMQRGFAGERTGLAGYVLYVLCMLYTCNYEIMAVTMLAGWILLLPRIRKALCGKTLYVIGLVIQAGSVLYMWQVPGNQIRMTMAAGRYAELHIVDRLRLGVVSTFHHFVSIPNVLYGVFCLILVFAVWENCTSVRARVISCIPLFMDMVLTVYYLIHDILLGGKRNYVFDEAELLPSAGRVWVEQILLISCCLTAVCAIIYAIRQIVGNREEFWMILFMLALGCASRMAMAFTDSLFESGTRTFLELYFVLAGCIGALIKYVGNSWARRIVAVALAGGMGINIILTIIPFLQNYS